MVMVEKFDPKRGWCDGIRCTEKDAKQFLRLNEWGYRIRPVSA